MSRSLSLVLPVCNAEKDLADNLQALLDVLSDFTESFEVVLVDQGSTDQTLEVARDLAVRYPQVRLVRHDACKPAGSDWQGTLAQTRGDLVFIQTSHAAVRPSALRQLWEIGAGAPRQSQTAALSRRRLPGQRRRGLPTVPHGADCTEVGELRMIRRD